MQKSAPGLLSLITRAAWSVRLKLVATAISLAAIGFGAGWIYRWVSEPMATPGTSLRPAGSSTTAASGSSAVPTGGVSSLEGTLYVLNGTGFVLNGGGGSVTEYPLGTTGDEEPGTVISGELTGISGYPTAMTLDRAGDIYVANSDTVLRFQARASGNIAPIAIIHGPATGLDDAKTIAVDTHGDIYVGMGRWEKTKIIEFGQALLATWDPSIVLVLVL